MSLNLKLVVSSVVTFCTTSLFAYHNRFINSSTAQIAEKACAATNHEDLKNAINSFANAAENLTKAGTHENAKAFSSACRALRMHMKRVDKIIHDRDDSGSMGLISMALMAIFKNAEPQLVNARLEAYDSTAISELKSLLAGRDSELALGA